MIAPALGLPPVEALRSRPGARLRVVRPGEPVFAAGEPGDGLLLVLPPGPGAPAPLLALLAGQGRASLAVDFAEAGDVVGEIETLRRLGEDTAGQRGLSALALTPTRLLDLSWPLIEDLLRRDQGLQARLAARLARRSLAMIAALHDAASLPLAARLAVLLERLLPLLGPTAPRRRGLTGDDLARLLGARRDEVSRQIAAWRRGGLLGTGPGRAAVVLDPARLGRLAEIGRREAADRPDAAIRSVVAAVEAGRAMLARGLALDLLPTVREVLALRHLAVLACARAGAREEARDLLTRFGFRHDGDMARLFTRLGGEGAPGGKAAAQLLEDITALEPRLMKDAALALPLGPARQAALQEAAEAYGRVHALTGRSYSAINAASLLAMAGAPEAARPYAETVLVRPDPHGPGYWPEVTRAEAELLLGRTEAALATLRGAAQRPDATIGARASTRRQLRALAPVLGLDQRLLDAALPQAAVVVLAAGRDAPTRAEAAALHRGLDGAGLVVVALSAGAAASWAEAAAAAPLHLVLPDGAPIPAGIGREAPSMSRLPPGTDPLRVAMGLAVLEAEGWEAPCHLLSAGMLPPRAGMTWRGLGFSATRLGDSPMPGECPPGMPLLLLREGALPDLPGVIGTAAAGTRRRPALALGFHDITALLAAVAVPDVAASTLRLSFGKASVRAGRLAGPAVEALRGSLSDLAPGPGFPAEAAFAAELRLSGVSARIITVAGGYRVAIPGSAPPVAGLVPQAGGGSGRMEDPSRQRRDQTSKP